MLLIKTRFSSAGITKKLCCTIFALVLLFSSFITASAKEIPYDTYTYWYDVSTVKKAVSAKSIYQVKKVISDADIGENSFASVNSVSIDENGNIYALDGMASKIYIFDSNYGFVKIIHEVTSNGDKLQFLKASHINVFNNNIYICDTENARVLVVDKNGNLIYQYILPDSHIIPEDFSFRPISVAVDSYGYTYVVSDGSYYGALLYSPENEFVGFYGSNDVSVGAISSMTAVFKRIFINNAKKAATATTLPYTFTDICVDKDNFVYTATGYTKGSQNGQIKKLSPGNGSDILYSSDTNFLDDEVNTSIRLNSAFNQSIASIDVDDYGYIYALDATYGRIYVYDQECRLLSAFGGGMKAGLQKGTFINSSSISVYNGDIYVVDSTKNSITVFEETDYCRLLKKARYLTLNGEFAEADPIWEEILAQDKNCQLAYSGLANARLFAGDYHSAMEYARQGYDRDTYSIAFEEVRNDWIAEHFWVFIIGVLFIVLMIAFCVLNAKKHFITVKNQNIKKLFLTPLHPIQNFNELQEKKMGSWLICVILVIVYYVVSVMEALLGGFAFTIYDPESFNSVFVLVRSVGLIMLWIIVNWAVSTLFSGKGKIKEIACVTCYSLLPSIIGKIFSIVLTNVLVPEESAFIAILYTVLQLYTLLLIVIGTVVIHDYDFKHFIGTTILTILGIAVVVFLAIMIFILIQQTITFIITLYTEITI